MNLITKIYKLRFKRTLIPHGFKVFGSSFYKVINDVVQTITLVERQPTYTVSFSIMPLFWGINSISNEGYLINQLRKGKMKRQWEFHSSSPLQYNDDEEYLPIVSESQYVEQMVNCMLSIIISDVVPFFERAIDCKTALDEIRKFETYLYGNEYAEKNEASNYLWHIKLGNYDKALKAIRGIMKHQQASGETEQLDRHYWIKSTEQLIARYKLQYELATSDDVQQSRLDMLLREDITNNFREHLLSDGWEMIFSIKNPSVAKKQIKELENDLALLMDENSPRSKELMELEISKKKARAGIDEQYSKLIELLTIPDTEYFHKHIKEQEAKSLEYLNSIGKRKTKPIR